FGPDYTAGCPSCSAIADGFDGFVVHLANHDVTLMAVSRAPLAKLQAYKRRMGWAFPWASSLGSDFNFDFTVSITEEQQREGAVEYNYQRSALDVKREAGREGNPVKFAAMTGTDVATCARERPGMSAFVLEDGVVYHTYSTCARGMRRVAAADPLQIQPPELLRQSLVVGSASRCGRGPATPEPSSRSRIATGTDALSAVFDTAAQVWIRIFGSVAEGRVKW